MIPMAMPTRNGVRDEAKPGSILLVIHDFVARSADELSLAKGDRIELIERDDDFGDGWFLGRHMVNGSSGLFPEVYTTSAPKGTLTNTNGQRRVSEGPPRSAGSTDTASTTSPTQQRHSSASALTQPRPASAASTQASPLAQTALRTSMPSSTSTTTGRTQTFNSDSPVMSETLSVIDEHITDMNTPRSSFAMNGNGKRDTIGSVYSTQALNRFSYIPGHETDEDEEHVFHTEDEVMAWSPSQVAEYLEDCGVERQHCEVFKDQEISGEVLLAMDQSSIFIKEFELGPVGRRLKTWHKIKALQDEVRARGSPAGVARSQHSSEGLAATGTGAGAMDNDGDSIASDAGRNRSSTVGTTLPRGLQPVVRQSLDGRSSTMQSQSTSASLFGGQAATAPNVARSSSSVISPLQCMTSLSRPENTNTNTRRPSAQNIRAMNHSRRHSSIDSTTSSTAGGRGHRKQPSFDSKWQPGQPIFNGTAAGVNGLLTSSAVPSHTHTMSAESTAPQRESSLVTPSSPGEVDKGFFSDNERENRTSSGGQKKVNLLTKKSSPIANANANGPVSPITQSRANSLLFGARTTAQPGRGVSMDGPVSPILPPTGGNSHMLNALGAVQNKFGSMRSATSPQLQNKPMADLTNPVSPVVTKLEYSEKPSLNAMASSPHMLAEESSKDGTPSPTNAGRSFSFLGGGQKTKSAGRRGVSDAVTKSEKNMADAPPVTSPTVESTTRTGSTTPSTETRSFDLAKSMDGRSGNSRTSTGSASKLVPALPTPATAKTQRKARPATTKKATSAYTRGLEKKGPKEQMEGADYSGWMKKKSGSLMTTWKSRLFVLRGRRLSYYYKEDDQEEKGLIDISFHRVLPAQNEMLTSLHASVTGAAGGPTSPTIGSTPTNAEKDLKENPPIAGDGEDDGLFIFKLVPPKSGLSKGVNFTKPTVHYFAVNSRREGRLWMAALMKATIDRDEDGVVTTTYNQKTISLAKARLRKERPPGLKEDEVAGRAELDGGGSDGEVEEKGLGITNEVDEKDHSTIAGAEEENEKVGLGDEESSIAPSSSIVPTPTGEEDGEVLNEKVGLPVEASFS